MKPVLRTERVRWLWRFFDLLLVFGGVAAAGLLVAELGFAFDTRQGGVLTRWVLLVFVLQELGRAGIVANVGQYIRERRPELVVAVVAGLVLLAEGVFGQGVWGLLGEGIRWEFFAAIAMQGMVLLGVALRLVRHHAVLGHLEVQPGVLLLASFALIAFIGTLLLLLPAATVEGIRPVDAVFTAVSAVCVTGLTVVDTAKAFTRFGQVVILLLIQVGGLGLMTFMSFFGALFTRGLGVRERFLLGEIWAVENLAQIRVLLGQIVALSVLVEGLGACVLYWSDGGGVPIDAERAFRAVFHAVSAFCNAGFSVYSENLVAQQHNVVYLSTIMVLVVVGGLGFPVVSALLALRPWARPTKRLQHRLSVSARLVLISTGVLIALGALAVWYLERDGVFRAFSPWEQWFQALFLSVVPRTAGFNSVPISELSPAASLVVIGLMWIGASPASTGGGVKTLTVAVALIGAVQLLAGKERVEVFHREIPVESVFKALVAVVASAAVLLGSAFCLQLLEPRQGWVDVLFEAASALGTVGLSRGITPELGTVSKLLLCLVMLVGRVGVLTVVASVLPARVPLHYRYPQERVIIT
jgi:potassium uptake TrkH family protein